MDGSNRYKNIALAIGILVVVLLTTMTTTTITTITIAPTPAFAKSSQSDRVGSHDDDRQTSGEGADKGGTVTDPTLCSEAEDDPDCDTTVTANCFGKVISHESREHKEDPDEGTLGEHSRDPVPELEGNETPRQGIGNQELDC